MVRNYLLVDGDGFATNAVLWDGETEYEPGEGLTLIEQPDGIGIGWHRDGDDWIAPEEPE